MERVADTIRIAKTAVLDLWNDDPLLEVCWSTWLTVRLLMATAIHLDTSNIFMKITIVCALLPLAVREVLRFKSYEHGDWILLACFAVLIPSAFVSKDTILIQSMAIAFAARKNNYQTLLRFTCLVLMVETVAVVLLSSVGVIPTVTHYDTRGYIRESFGFAYPSRLPNILLTLVLSMQCIAERGRVSFPAALIAVASIIVFWFGRSRGPFAFTIMAILVWTAGSMLPELEAKARRVFGVLFASSYAVCALVMTYLCATYNKEIPWMKAINDVTSNRLLYSNNAFKSAKPSLFGTSMFSEEINVGVGYLDSSYLKLLLTSGILAFVIVMALFMRCAYQAAMKNNVGLAGALFVVALHATMEWQLTSIMYTPMMFCLFMDTDALSEGPSKAAGPRPKHLANNEDTSLDK